MGQPAVPTHLAKRNLLYFDCYNWTAPRCDTIGSIELEKINFDSVPPRQVIFIFFSVAGTVSYDWIPTKLSNKNEVCSNFFVGSSNWDRNITDFLSENH